MPWALNGCPARYVAGLPAAAASRAFSLRVRSRSIPYGAVRSGPSTDMEALATLFTVSSVRSPTGNEYV